MRISTSSIYDSNVALLNQQQSKLFQTQQQIATGRRMVTPADDPASAARALEVGQSDSMNTQYATNRTSAINTLSLVDGALQNVSFLYQSMRSVATAAGNTILSNAERLAMASDLEGQLQELVGQANSTDGAGTYLFSGFQGSTIPFVNTAAGVQYFGDDGQRLVQVSSSRQLASTDPGSDVFMRVKNGNGTVSFTPSVANTGSGVANVGQVVNPASLTGANYQVAFTVAAGVTTYTVTNTTAAPPTQVLPALPATGAAYVSGQAITFDGLQMSISGAPANGDTFTVAPSTSQSAFQTMTNLINALKQPIVAGIPSTSAAVSQSVADALSGLDNALNKVLTVRASVGARMNEADSLKASGDSLALQFQQTLSQLQDLDYNKAMSDLSQQQLSLQAAQKSFVQVSGLSLFSYM
jgi:flagellar hook-associated protein 3 FlgL